jgi:putative ABC transport system permease protein
MDTLFLDLRYSLRRLVKSPGFSLIVILTLALGIGANTAIFSAVNAVLLRPLPYRAPERLVMIEHHYPSLGDLHAPVSAPGFRDYQEKARSFESVAVEGGWAANLTGVGEPVRVPAARVAGRFFLTLGVPALIGRTIQPGEDSAGRGSVVVLSYGIWQRLFGGERSVLGRTLTLNGESFQVVGVMPPEFRDFFNREVDLWVPLVFEADQLADGQRTSEWLNLTARLREGVPLAQAAAELHGLGEQLKRQFTDSYAPDWGLVLTPPERAGDGQNPPRAAGIAGRRGIRAPHRLRQRGQPPAGAGRHPAGRVLRPGASRACGNPRRSFGRRYLRHALRWQLVHRQL